MAFWNKDKQSPEPQGEKKRWEPTKEFYESNPRAREIREVTLEIARKVELLMEDPDVASDKQRQAELYAGLERDNGKLISLGIKPNMNTKQPQERYEKDPVFAAEYVAGQMLDLTGEHHQNISDVMPTISEMSDAKLALGDTEAHLISGKNVTPKLRNFMVGRSMVNLAFHFVGGDDEAPDQK